MTPDDSPLARYKALWLQLDALDKAGKFESSEADAIRDASDEPWYAMTAEDRAELESWLEEQGKK